MWKINEEGNRQFGGGKEDWEVVAKIAAQCINFKADDEDEWVADEAISCYNCCYRRWTAKSFICCK